MNLYDQVWLKLPSNDQRDWLNCNLDMYYDRINLVMKIGLIAVVFRDLGVYSI